MLLAVLGPHQDRRRSCAYDRSKEPARDRPRYTSVTQTDPRAGGEGAGLAVPPKGMGEAPSGSGSFHRAGRDGSARCLAPTIHRSGNISNSGSSAPRMFVTRSARARVEIVFSLVTAIKGRYLAYSRQWLTKKETYGNSGIKRRL